MFTMFILFMLIGSMLLNVWQYNHPQIKRVVEYKEIEVIKKAVCECGHPSSVHSTKFGCREKVRMDGIIRDERNCRCRRYTGPKPLSEVFADDLEVTTTRVGKALNRIGNYYD